GPARCALSVTAEPVAGRPVLVDDLDAARVAAPNCRHPQLHGERVSVRTDLLELLDTRHHPGEYLRIEQDFPDALPRIRQQMGHFHFHSRSSPGRVPGSFMQLRPGCARWQRRSRAPCSCRCAPSAQTRSIGAFTTCEISRCIRLQRSGYEVAATAPY